ncbi:DUF469 family protein [Salmonella enterica subsp. enterica]|nr:DUF469 family protein [Salmonella enterica subsp. enterica]
MTDCSGITGFSVACVFRKVHLKSRSIRLSMTFINDVIEPNKLAFDGSGHPARKGCRFAAQEIGKCTEEHQA